MWFRTPSGARSRTAKTVAVPRVLDIYAALPAITGKIELEYEGELKGGDAVSRELIRTAVAKVYNRYFEGVNMQPVVQWFDIGGTLKLNEDVSSAEIDEPAQRNSGSDGEDPGAGTDRQ